VKDGIFTSYLMSRETAAALGVSSNATMRADGWARLPLIRMTNVSVMPGTAGTLDDLVGDTDDGANCEPVTEVPRRPADERACDDACRGESDEHAARAGEGERRSLSLHRRRAYQAFVTPVSP